MTYLWRQAQDKNTLHNSLVIIYQIIPTKELSIIEINDGALT